MPHGESWFSVLFPELFEGVSHQIDDWFGKPWIGGEHINVQHLFGSLFVVLLITAIAAASYRRERNPREALVPDARASFRTVVELLTEISYGMMAGIMGGKAAKYFLPLIGTCAFFILFSNVLGLVPGFLPPTQSLNVTLALSLVVAISTQIFGLKENGFNYIAHFFGPVRRLAAAPLMILFLGLELFAHLLVRPGSLSVRLMANMTADHMVLETFHRSWGLNAVADALKALALGIPAYGLGLLVCIVQTVVFCLLSTVYIALAVEHQEH